MKLELALSIASGQSGKIASRIALKSCLNHFQKKNLNDAILANPLDYKLELSFSLTHHNKVGACLMAKIPNVELGIDLEQASRKVDQKVIQRISHQDDEYGDLTPLQIWCAKEACFKAIYPNNKLYLKDIILNDPVAYSTKSSKKFHYYFLENHDHLISISLPRDSYFKVQFL